MADLFYFVNSLDTQGLLKFSIDNMIPLDIPNDEGNSLIHEVINNNDHPENSELNLLNFLFKIMLILIDQIILIKHLYI
jgi:hypothetical protein